MGTVMRIDHNGDLTNSYVQAFRDKHIFGNFATQYTGHVLREKIDADAIEALVSAELKQYPVDYVTAAGHGRYEVFLGVDHKAIWSTRVVWDVNSASVNLTLLSDKIVHLLACESGAMLGRAIVQEGAKAFWGYNVNFVFVHSTNPPSLMEDELAEVFLNMDIVIDRGILKSIVAMDIYDSIERYIATALTNFRNEPLYRGYLLSNFVHLACPMVTWGDKLAVL
jgi:hypothetical protein